MTQPKISAETWEQAVAERMQVDGSGSGADWIRKRARELTAAKTAAGNDAVRALVEKWRKTAFGLDVTFEPAPLISGVVTFHGFDFDVPLMNRPLVIKFDPNTRRVISVKNVKPLQGA